MIDVVCVGGLGRDVLGLCVVFFSFGDSWCLRLGIPFARSLRRLIETFVLLLF